MMGDFIEAFLLLIIRVVAYVAGVVLLLILILSVTGGLLE